MSDDLVVNFHPRPGARERHLQRRHGNVLFGESSQVTQAQVNEARDADVAEFNDFIVAVKKLFDDASNLAPNVESDVILEMKADCDRLYEQSCGLGGDVSKEQEAVKKLTQALMKAVWQGAGNDTEAHSELEQEEEARAEHYRLLNFPLVADLLRPDSPVDEEDLLPVLLSEDQESVTMALMMFAPEHRVLMSEQGESLLQNVKAGDSELAKWRERLLFISEF